MEEQYRNASNLNARIALHRRFSTSEYPWPRWVFDQVEVPPEGRILEIGCGTGRLWQENLDRIPPGWCITLTDASPAMLREAEENLQGRKLFNQVAEARQLPFGDDSFDVLIANHMLYHVSDRPKAFSEIVRVLKPDGTLYATTNGRDHHREMGWMLSVLGFVDPPARPQHLDFSLENGLEQLLPWFSEISLLQHDDTLIVAEIDPLIDYLLSTRVAKETVRQFSEEEFAERVSELTSALNRELSNRGVIHITKDAGMFIARF